MEVQNAVIHFVRKQLWPHLSQHIYALVSLSATLGLYFTILFAKIIILKSDGLFVGHPYLAVDWPLHIGIASIFAYQQPSYWFQSHILFSGGKFTYPFVTDMISGLLIRFGYSIPLSFILPSIITAWILLFGMYSVFFQLTRSTKTALLAIAIFFLASGPGFLLFFRDWFQHPTLGELAYSATDYSRIEKYTWLAGNFIDGELLPQRTFLLGMSVGVWVFAILLFVFSHKTGKNTRTLHKSLCIFAGVLAGILPIIHVHSFIIVALITGVLCLVYFERLEEWFYYFTATAVISNLVFFQFIAGGIQNPQFMSLMIGWSAQGMGIYGWLKMWLEIWGVMLPLAVFSFMNIYKKKMKLVTTFYLGFFIVFILSNLVLFQPIQWDNSKLFVWSYFGFSGLAAEGVVWLWKKKKTYQVLSIVLILSLTATGFLKLLWIQRTDLNQQRISSIQDIDLGRIIREQTGPQAIFLTAPAHSNPVMMWGARPIVMGDEGWVFNFGFLYNQRLEDIYTMYSGVPETFSLLRKYHISYVAIGSDELEKFSANEHFFQDNFPLFTKEDGYRIYDTRSALSDADIIQK